MVKLSEREIAHIKQTRVVPSQERTGRQDKIHAEMIDAGYVVKKQLPEYFAIKQSDDPRRPKYIDWLNEKYDKDFHGSGGDYFFGLRKEGVFYCGSLEPYQVELTLDEREEMVGSQESNSVEIDLIKNKRTHYTYTTITTKTRNDGVQFTETTIDGTPVEEIKKQIKEHRAEAKRLQGLIHSHNALFPKSK